MAFPLKKGRRSAGRIERLVVDSLYHLTVPIHLGEVGGNHANSDIRSAARSRAVDGARPHECQLWGGRPEEFHDLGLT